MGNRRLRRLKPIRGRLPPAGLPEWIGNHKGHEGHKGYKGDFGGLEMWGAAPRPGREKFSLHPRHVCDVPKGADAPRRTENRACRREAPNLPRLWRTERPCGRRVKWCARAFRSHRRQGWRPGLQPLGLLQASKPLSFQASNNPCTPGTSATCQEDDGIIRMAQQEIQEMQEVQECA